MNNCRLLSTLNSSWNEKLLWKFYLLNTENLICVLSYNILPARVKSNCSVLIDEKRPNRYLKLKGIHIFYLVFFSEFIYFKGTLRNWNIFIVSLLPIKIFVFQFQSAITFFGVRRGFFYCCVHVSDLNSS